MQFTKTKLKNGLQVITVPMKDNPTVTVLVLVATGSKYESKKENGLSHFLEHMCFKGTTKRPTVHDIVGTLDGLGTQYNAFTGHEYTGYYAKGAAEHTAELFDIVSDIYLNSTFPEKEMEKEKGVIVEEINMYEDMPQSRVQDSFMSLMYGDQPVGWTITGTKETVRGFTREDFVRYHNEHYVPNATTVVVAGKVTEKNVLSYVTRAFGSVKRRAKKEKKPTVIPTRGSRISVIEKTSDQTHLVLGFSSYAYGDVRNPAQKILATVIGGGMSSRLFMKLREELGVAYYVYAGAMKFTDHGHFSISAGVANERVSEVLREIVKELASVAKNGITDAELARVKEYIVGNMKLELESSDSFASLYGNQAVLGQKLKGPEEIEKEIRKVTKQAVQKVAQDIFKAQNARLALIGPQVNVQDLEEILKF